MSDKPEPQVEVETSEEEIPTSVPDNGEWLTEVNALAGASGADAPVQAVELSTEAAVEMTLDDVDEQLADLRALLEEQISEPAEAAKGSGRRPPGAAVEEPPVDPGAATSAAPAGTAGSQNADGATGPAAEGASDSTTSHPDGAVEQSVLGRVRSMLTAVPRGALAFMVTVVTWADRPFSFVPVRLKPLLGYLALGTSLVAALTWFLLPAVLPN